MAPAARLPQGPFPDLQLRATLICNTARSLLQHNRNTAAQVRGLVRQHIDSFIYLINTEMREIVHANRSSANTHTTHHTPHTARHMP